MITESQTTPKKISLRISTPKPFIWVSILAIADTFGGILYGIFPVTLFLRSFAILYLIIYIISSKILSREFKMLLYLLMLFLITKILYNYLIDFDADSLLVEIPSSLKLLYFPLLFSYLHCQLQNSNISYAEVRYLISFYGWLIIFSLLIGHFSGLGGEIGGRGLQIAGGKGFMIGANEVGLMMILTAPYVGVDFIKRLGSVFVGGVTQLLMYSLAGFHVFTKSSLIASIISAFSLYHSMIKQGRLTRWIARSAFLLTCIYIINIVSDNLDTIEIFLRSTFFSTLLDKDISTFLFRGRQNYISAIYPQLVEHDFSWLIILFGAGESFIRDVSVLPLMLEYGKGTTFEMDLFDLFGAFGIVGMFLYVAVIARMYIIASPYRMPYHVKLSVFAVIIHSVLAGHVIFSPQVTTLIALVLLNHRIDLKKGIDNQKNIIDV